MLVSRNRVFLRGGRRCSDHWYFAQVDQNYLERELLGEGWVIACGDIKRVSVLAWSQPLHSVVIRCEVPCQLAISQFSAAEKV